MVERKKTINYTLNWNYTELDYLQENNIVTKIVKDAADLLRNWYDTSPAPLWLTSGRIAEDFRTGGGPLRGSSSPLKRFEPERVKPN